MYKYSFSHDTLRDFIASHSIEIFGISCIALKEVPAVIEGEVRRADLVLVSQMIFPYVRIVEVKTKFEEYREGIRQLLWFKERGLANYYFLALPESEVQYLDYYEELFKRNIGLLVLKPKKHITSFEIEVKKVEPAPKFEVRERDWVSLYKELERVGKRNLADWLKRTVGKTPLG